MEKWLVVLIVLIQYALGYYFGFKHGVDYCSRHLHNFLEQTIGVQGDKLYQEFVEFFKNNDTWH